MEIVVDPPKRLANLKHGFDQNDFAADFDFLTAKAVPTKSSRTGRARVVLIGRWTDGLWQQWCRRSAPKPCPSSACAPLAKRSEGPMSKTERAPGFVPGQGFSMETWDEVCDHPELSDDQIAALKPLEQVLPGVAAAARRTRGPQKTPTKELISLRIDRRVLDHFRATGPGWQSRMNAALAKTAGLD